MVQPMKRKTKNMISRDKMSYNRRISRTETERCRKMPPEQLLLRVGFYDD